LSITNRLYSLKMRRKKNTKFDLHSKSWADRDEMFPTFLIRRFFY
jgi:hypothetical protein